MNLNSVRFLSIQNVLFIHTTTIEEEGGSTGVRDEGLLASALEMPQATFAGQLLHTDLAAMAAAYLYHICQNHAFVDGNKRTAAFSTVLFLDINNATMEDLLEAEQLEKVTLKVASGTMTKSDVILFFRDLMNSDQA